MIKLKRAYDAVSRTDGTRFLVERLWPRGLSKPTLQLDAWLKEVGPSTALRKWFSRDPDKWREFRRRYFRELDSRPEAWQPITSAARGGHGHTRVQLARYGAPQCCRVEGVRASDVAPAREVESSVGGAPAAVIAVNHRGESPASLSQVRAAASSAVPSGSYGLGNVDGRRRP